MPDKTRKCVLFALRSIAYLMNGACLYFAISRANYLAAFWIVVATMCMACDNTAIADFHRLGKIFDDIFGYREKEGK